MVALFKSWENANTFERITKGAVNPELPTRPFGIMMILCSSAVKISVASRCALRHKSCLAP